MALTVKLDLIQSAEAVDSFSERMRRRVAVVTGIDTSNPAEVLQRIMDIPSPTLPALGAQYPGAGEALPLMQKQITIAGHDTAFVTMIYRYVEDAAGVAPTTTIITASSRVGQVTTDLLPETLLPLYVSRGYVNEENYTAGITTIPSDIAEISYLRPMRELNIQQMSQGNPNTSHHQAVGCVNSDLFQGRPRGHWLLTDYTTSYSKYAGYYEMRASCIARGSDAKQNDWSEYAILKNQQTGRKAFVAQTPLELLMLQDYAPGSIGSLPGIRRVGPYPMVSFNQIFGPLLPPSNQFPSNPI